MALKWTCVRTHSQAERWASRNLQRQGYETYLPLVPVKRRDRVVRSLWHSVEAPLFAGYVFLRHDPESSWTPIRETPGVRCVLRCGTQMAYTSDMAIAGLQEALQAGEAVSALGTHPASLWAPGVPCSLATGPFQGYGGVVLQVGVDTALISLLVFGGLREVLVRQSSLVERVA